MARSSELAHNRGNPHRLGRLHSAKSRERKRCVGALYRHLDRLPPIGYEISSDGYVAQGGAEASWLATTLKVKAVARLDVGKADMATGVISGRGKYASMSVHRARNCDHKLTTLWMGGGIHSDRPA